MFRAVPVVFILAATTAFAGSIGSYSGCRSLKGERGACEACVGGGNFYQPGQGCGMVAGMHKSKAVAKTKPPPKPTAMPKWQKDYATIKPGTFAIGARPEDEFKDSMKDMFEGVKVTITRPFLMKTTEVTHGEYYFVTGTPSTSYDKACGMDCPVNAVSWVDAVRYLNALSKKEGLEPCYELKGEGVKWVNGLDCKGYRLPTDAEWEFAARGGLEEPVYGPLDDIAWHYDNSDGKPHVVGKKKPNAYGLYDMLGNAWEYVWDAEKWKPYPEDVSDPIIGGDSLETLGQDRICRGGSYGERAYNIRASVRFQEPASAGGDAYGFRPVRTVTDSK